MRLTGVFEPGRRNWLSSVPAGRSRPRLVSGLVVERGAARQLCLSRPRVLVCDRTDEVDLDGPVIPPDEVDRLFEPFRQLHGERTRHGGGHGLGLAIVSAVASAHDANLAVRTRPDGGLDITVMFRP
jgi:signal transduction histidine kinase